MNQERYSCPCSPVDYVLLNGFQLSFFGFLYMECHLANASEPSMCGGYAALCQITLTTCFCLLFYSALHT